jgi:hypothetical protein
MTLTDFDTLTLAAVIRDRIAAERPSHRGEIVGMECLAIAIAKALHPTDLAARDGFLTTAGIEYGGRE